ATGSQSYIPAMDMLDCNAVATVDDVLLNRKPLGSRVVIADWKGDWIGVGIAEKLAREGHDVRLYCNAALVGEALQTYTRNHYVGRLYKCGVEMHTHARLYGCDEDTVFFQNTLSNEAIVVEGVNSLVASLGYHSESALEEELRDAQIPTTAIGDCVVPRSAEEAIYEGLTVAMEI
ncbi:MAG: oxidoreductase, partial [Pseudomonadota bacterium]